MHKRLRPSIISRRTASPAAPELAAQAHDAAPARAAGMRITAEALAHARTPSRQQNVSPYNIPAPAPGVVPPGSDTMAMDAGISALYGWADPGVSGSYAAQAFPGYAYLAELSQISEYRNASETLAEEMTRCWIDVVTSGDEDKSEKIAEITARLNQIGARQAFCRAALHDGEFGHGWIYIDLGLSADIEDDETSKPMVLTPSKISKGSLKGLVNIEPMWVYPYLYNSTMPWKADYFKPSQWYIMAKRFHSSRLLSFISREVPDILKPAYQFGGISLSQLMQPYVNNWLRIRQAVADSVCNYSVMVLLTNMSGALNGGGGEQERLRAQLFNEYRQVNGVYMANVQDNEDVKNVAQPLAGLHELQAQAQEHMAAPSKQPLVKLTGITPSGLNASSKDEMDCWRDYILAAQEKIFGPNLDILLKVVQLDLYGEIDPDITYKFRSLETPNEISLATVRKTDAETAQILINAGVIDSHEDRARIAADVEGPYPGLDMDKEIVPPHDPSNEGLGEEQIVSPANELETETGAESRDQ